jgi:hypothetical protein
VSNNNKATIDAVRLALSPARLATYEAAARVNPADDDLSALVLYAWNAQVSGALLAPLHVCEVVIRNAVADAFEAVYGHQWAWSATFERSLPDPIKGYSQRKDLMSARRSALTTGKVIPELKFVFWQKMFTSRYDIRLWDPHLQRILPNMNGTHTVAARRSAIYKDLEQLRNLRNRIAHHEPIFTRNLADDYQKILDLVGFRCSITSTWLDQNQTATKMIAEKP